MNRYPFCVIERPFMVWGDNISADNLEFLEHVDAQFYWRAAHSLIQIFPTDEATDDNGEQGRKDIASLARLLWHHGAETLVILLGAYIQAPRAVHAYFLKCRTEDALALARLLRRGEKPKYNRLTEGPLSVANLVNGIHVCAGWADPLERLTKFTTVLANILREFTSEEHRWEYNSIKHGLRAHHGRFALAVGIQETPGIPAPPEAMEFVGYSRDASFFNVAKPLQGSTRQAAKVNFVADKVSVSWSLEKVLAELQLLSLLINNCASALRIVAGAQPGTVTFYTVSDAEADGFWTTYLGLHAGNVPTATIGTHVDVKDVKPAQEKEVFASYKRPRDGQ